MSKALSFSLIFLALVGGILLGNQYGRRDLENSKPVSIAGELNRPGAVTVRGESVMTSLPFYNASRTATVGAAAVVWAESLEPSREGEAIIYLWNLPEILLQPDLKLKLSVFSTDNQFVSDITEVMLSQSQILKLGLPKMEAGQYLVFRSPDGVVQLRSGEVK